MVPFDGFAYFAVLLLVLPAAVILRLLTPTARAAIMATTIGMVAIQYGATSPMTGNAMVGTSATVAAHALYQSLLVAVRGLAREATTAERRGPPRRTPSTRTVLDGVIALAVLPLALKFMLVLELAIGFLGISYVTFRSLDVIFGIRDRLIVSLPADQFLAFLFFFPAISSGPIDRYRRFSHDWNRPRLPGNSGRTWMGLSTASSRASSTSSSWRP